jgi:hypothetical protein
METTMRKLLTFLIALGAIIFAVVSPASANAALFLAGPKPVASYVGPGDIAEPSTTGIIVLSPVSCRSPVNSLLRYRGRRLLFGLGIPVSVKRKADNSQH